MTDEYIKVIPSDERYDPAAAVDVVRGIHGISSSTAPPEGFVEKVLSKVGGAEYPTFEFVALSRGTDEPIECYYGVDDADALTTLEHRLRELYPESFTIERTPFDVGKALVRPVELTPTEFLTAASEGELWADLSVTDAGATAGTADEMVETDGGSLAGDTEGVDTVDDRLSADPVGVTIDTVQSCIEESLQPPQSVPNAEGLSLLDGPALTHEGTVLARPSPADVRPVGIRWHGVGDRKRDWMTQLRSFSDVSGADLERQVRETQHTRRLPLAPVLDQLGETSVPMAYQVTFERKASWEAQADSRIDDLKRQSDTFLEGMVGSFDKADVSDLPDRYRGRIESIEDNDPAHCFRATVRALTVELEPEYGEVPAAVAGTDASADAAVTQFGDLLDDLNGDYYHLEPTRFRSEGWRTSTQEQNVRAAFERVRDGELYTGSGKSRPDLVVNPDELPSFIAVPSEEDLTTAGARAVRTESVERNPLPRPDPDELSAFRQGMTLGYPKDENGQPADDPVRLPPRHLTRHYARFASTGSGKSVATQTDVLSLHAETEGATIVIEPKGDNWCEEYCQTHYKQFGTLKDVYHFRLPEDLPCLPLFDIRPALAGGVDRETAIQEVKAHFRELMRLVMGADQFERASVSTEILGQLIAALFDEEHGSDAFTLDDLVEAATRMRHEREVPTVKRERAKLDRLLHRHLEKDDVQFDRTMDGVLNRLSFLEERTHIAAILNTVPEWDPRRERYMGGLDFQDVIDEDVVVLFDTGDLKRESRDALSMLVLSNLWHSLQPRRRAATSTDELPLVNMIIEEAASVASSSLVYEELLPKGRSFGIGLGLIMQYPNQVVTATGSGNAGQRAYEELLNNVGTKVVGKINTTDDLAAALATGGLSPAEMRTRLSRLPGGEWVVSLPDTEFGGTVPATFSIESMEIPAGHPESDQPLQGRQREAFVTQFQSMERRVNNWFTIEAVENSDRLGRTPGAADGEAHPFVAMSVTEQTDGPHERQSDQSRRSASSATDERSGSSSQRGADPIDNYAPTSNGTEQSSGHSDTVDERPDAGTSPSQRADQTQQSAENPSTVTTSEGVRRQTMSPSTSDKSSEENPETSSSDPLDGDTNSRSEPTQSGSTSQRQTKADQQPDLSPSGNNTSVDDFEEDQAANDQIDEYAHVDEDDHDDEGTEELIAPDPASRPWLEKLESGEMSEIHNDIWEVLCELAAHGWLKTAGDSEAFSDRPESEPKWVEDLDSCEMLAVDEDIQTILMELSKVGRLVNKGQDDEHDDEATDFHNRSSQSSGNGHSTDDGRSTETLTGAEHGATPGEEVADSPDNAVQTDSPAESTAGAVDQTEPAESHRTLTEYEETGESSGAEQPASGPTPGEEGNAESDPVDDSEDTDDPSPDDSVSREERNLLAAVHAAMTGSHPHYSLFDGGMKPVTSEFDADPEALVERGYMSKHWVCRNKYYSVLPKGREVIGKHPNTGPGEGDLGELTPHIAGTSFTAEWLQQKEDVAQVKRYYERDGQRYDVVGLAEDGEITWVVEVECASNNPEAVVADYEHMAALDATALWVCHNSDLVSEVLSILRDRDYLSDISDRQIRTPSEARDTLADQTAPGIDSVRTFNEVYEEL